MTILHSIPLSVEEKEGYLIGKGHKTQLTTGELSDIISDGRIVDHAGVDVLFSTGSLKLEKG
jgi:hypothetical protein